MKYLDKMRRKKLGELLIEEGLVSSDQVVEALKEQKKTGAPIGNVLVSFGAITEWDIARTMCNQFQLPFIHTAKYSLDAEVLDLIPGDVLHRYQCVPLDRFDSFLTLAISGPLNEDMIAELETTSGCELFLYVALASDVRYSLDQHFPVDGPVHRSEESDEMPETLAAALDSAEADEWEKLFDMANESILSEIQPEDLD